MPDDQQPTPMQDIQRLVKDGLGDANVAVRDAIVSNLVKEELGRRIRAATSVYNKIGEAEKELKAIRPSVLGYGANGEARSEPVFTKEQVEKIKKTNETLAKLNGALQKALVEKDFSKVFELGGN